MDLYVGANVKKTIMWLCMALSVMAGSLEMAFQQAKKENKLLLLFVESPSCPYCLQMKQEVLSQSSFKRKLGKQYLTLIMEGAEAMDEGFQTKYFPTTYLIDPNTQKIVDELPGYMRANDFIDFLKEVYAQERG